MGRGVNVTWEDRFISIGLKMHINKSKTERVLVVKCVLANKKKSPDGKQIKILSE